MIYCWKLLHVIAVDSEKLEVSSNQTKTLKNVIVLVIVIVN